MQSQGVGKFGPLRLTWCTFSPQLFYFLCTEQAHDHLDVQKSETHNGKMSLTVSLMEIIIKLLTNTFWQLCCTLGRAWCYEKRQFEFFNMAQTRSQPNQNRKLTHKKNKKIMLFYLHSEGMIDLISIQFLLLEIFPTLPLAASFVLVAVLVHLEAASSIASFARHAFVLAT